MPPASLAWIRSSGGCRQHQLQWRRWQRRRKGLESCAFQQSIPHSSGAPENQTWKEGEPTSTCLWSHRKKGGLHQQRQCSVALGKPIGLIACIPHINCAGEGAHSCKAVSRSLVRLQYRSRPSRRPVPVFLYPGARIATREAPSAPQHTDTSALAGRSSFAHPALKVEGCAAAGETCGAAGRVCAT